MKAGLSLIVSSIVFVGAALGQITSANGDVVFLHLPDHVSASDLQSLTRTVKDRLYGRATEWLRLHSAMADNDRLDRIIVFIDEQGRPILPDLEAARRCFASRTFSSAQTNGNELTFTFDSPSNPWTPDEIADLTTQLSDYYPAAKAVYGTPAFKIAVNLRKDPNIPNAGLYFPSINEMIVKDVSQHDVICHEMIHAFRDDDLLGLSSYEEGMTRAAEVEVFDRLANYIHSFDENHGYDYDIFYDALNRTAIGSRSGSFFNTNPNTFVLLRYQLAGYAWWKGLAENPQFLAGFNQRLYAAIMVDGSTAHDEAKLVEIAASIQPTLEGLPFRTWYVQQAVLNTSPPPGYFLYQRINQFTFDYFHRDNFGSETMQANAVINWAVYDHDNILRDSGSGLTSAFGNISVSPNIASGYSGRLKIVISATSPDGPISNTTFRIWGAASDGVFGVIDEANSGSITITSLDGLTSPLTASVVNGAFAFPSLLSFRGRFSATFTHPDGHSISKTFNKDASYYDLLLRDDPNFRITVATYSPSSGFTLSWNAQPEHYYQILRSADPSFTKYETIALNLKAGATTETFTDSSNEARIASQFFYRVDLQP